MGSVLRGWGVWAVLLLACVAFSGQAGDAPTLKAGDPAPALKVGKWIKGGPIDSFEAGKVYVVEFWATWCGPCKKAIPHLSELNTKYKDKGVVFIGVDVWERDPAAAEPFVKLMGDKMNYNVVLDEPVGQGGAASKAWLRAAGLGGIPSTFLVNQQGKVAWIGHPMKLESVLTKVLAGSFDIAKHAEQEAKQKELSGRLRAALEANNGDDILRIADEMIALNPESAPQFTGLKVNTLLTVKKDYPAAYALAAKSADADWKDDSRTLNQVAWMILTAKDLEKRDLDLALKMAVRANELTQHENPINLNTLARAHFDKGDAAKAVEIQTKAVEKGKGAKSAEAMTAALEKYKAAK